MNPWIIYVITCYVLTGVGIHVYGKFAREWHKRYTKWSKRIPGVEPVKEPPEWLVEIEHGEERIFGGLFLLAPVTAPAIAFFFLSMIFGWILSRGIRK